MLLLSGSCLNDLQPLQKRRPRRNYASLALGKERSGEAEKCAENGQESSNPVASTGQGDPEGLLTGNSHSSSNVPNPSQSRSREGLNLDNQSPNRAHSPQQDKTFERDISREYVGRPVPENGHSNHPKHENAAHPREHIPLAKVTTANGDVPSEYCKNPSLTSKEKLFEEPDYNHLYPIDHSLIKRKSLSDSLLFSVPQNHHKNNEPRNGKQPCSKNVGRENGQRSSKINNVSESEDEPNFTKQNGSPFAHTKPPPNNGSRCKHSEEKNKPPRDRTTTHPFYDPVEVPGKKRRNAACTMAILSSAEHDFLETNI